MSRKISEVNFAREGHKPVWGEQLLRALLLFIN